MDSLEIHLLLCMSNQVPINIDISDFAHALGPHFGIEKLKGLEEKYVFHGVQVLSLYQINQMFYSRLWTFTAVWILKKKYGTYISK